MSLLSSEKILVREIKIYIDNEYIDAILEAMDSDIQEVGEYAQNFKSLSSSFRENLWYLLSRIYAKLVPRRKRMLSRYMEIFNQIIYEGRNYNGLRELLNLYSNIVRGFSVPLREDHDKSFDTYILPLFTNIEVNN